MSTSRSRLVIAVFFLIVALCFGASAWASMTSKAWAGGEYNSAMLDEDLAKREPDPTTKKKNIMPKITPTQAIKDLDAKLDDFKVGDDLTAEQEEYNRKLKMDIIHGTFDIRELSRLALARHWNGLSQAQRDNFVDLMVSLLEEKALFSKEQSAAKSKSGGKYKVLYKGHKYSGKDKSKAFVRTKVVIPAENIDINLNYKLKRQDGEWKIYDVIVDEASLVANYKYQFNSIITKHSYDELVSRMTKKLNEIKTDRADKKAKRTKKS